MKQTRNVTGVLAVPDILKYSSNIGAAKIAQKMGKESSMIILNVLVSGRDGYRSARRVHRDGKAGEKLGAS